MKKYSRKEILFGFLVVTVFVLLIFVIQNNRQKNRTRSFAADGPPGPFYVCRFTPTGSVPSSTPGCSGQACISPSVNPTPSRTRTPTSVAQISPTTPPVNNAFQPTAPYYTTFFYLWSENPNTDGRWSYWSDIGNNPPNTWFSHYLPDLDTTRFDPATELYSSRNDAALIWQLGKLKEAKIEVAIASWWGPNHKSDTAFRKIITDVMKRPTNPYPNLRWGVYYEKEGFGDPPVDTELVPDLTYIVNNYTNQPGFLKINGRPVIFVYNAAHSGFNALNDLTRWQQAKAKVKTATGVDIYVVLKRDPLSSGAAANAIDGWHEYAPAVRTNSLTPHWYMVSPGFWLDDGSAQRLVRDLAAFQTAVTNMVNANVTWKLIETWNEWGEGSSVEPADPVRLNSSTGREEIDPGAPPFKNQYIDVLSRSLPALESGGGSNPNPPPPTPTNVAPTSGAGSVVAVAVGDIACGADSAGAACREWQTSELSRQINPAAILLLGDNQYEAGQLRYYNGIDPFCQSNPPRCYNATWGRFKSITYPSVGNHEYGTPGAAGHFDYFNGVGSTTGRAGARDKGYFSYNLGNWHMVVLNTNCSSAGGCGAGSPQETWLRQDLAQNTKLCTAAYFHHPRFNSGHEGNNTTLIAQSDALWQAMYNGNVDVALAGHAHHYERFAPQTPAGVADNARGIRQFIVGTGGRNFTGFWGTKPNSQVRNNNTFGVLKLTLNSSSYDWQFVPIAGSTFTDSGSFACH